MGSIDDFCVNLLNHADHAFLRLVKRSLKSVRPRSQCYEWNFGGVENFNDINILSYFCPIFILGLSVWGCRVMSSDL